MSKDTHYLKQELYDLIKTDSSIFEFIQKGSLDGMWYWDLEKPEHEWMSPEFWAILGYNHKDKKHLAAEWQDIINQDDLQTALENFSKHCADPNHPYDQIVRYKHKEGNTVWIRCRGMAIRDENGKAVRMLGAHTDITEIMELKRKAEESDMLKSAFLANMSHEIRTPMNAIVGFSSFLTEEDNTTEDIKKYANIIINSGSHLLNLINDIVDISKIETGQIAVNPEPVDISNLLRELYHFFHSQLIAKGKYDVQLFLQETKSNIIAETDKTRLRQILINLIGNAIKFTHKGYVEFGCQQKDDKLLFFIKDTGIGISPENQEIIFERFRQVDESSDKKYSGTGLGLAISKACAEMLGGKIWIQSIPDKGSTFYFNIDYRESNKKPQRKSNPQSKRIAFNGELVLIAEDDSLSYEFLHKFLSGSNLKVIRALNGKEAVEMAISNHDVKLILMDIRMPGMNGCEATKLIREQKPDLPIIAQTAFAYQTDREKCLSLGCNDFISKPTAKGDLLNLINKYLETTS